MKKDLDYLFSCRCHSRVRIFTCMSHLCAEQQNSSIELEWYIWQKEHKFFFPLPRRAFQRGNTRQTQREREKMQLKKEEQKEQEKPESREREREKKNFLIKVSLSITPSILSLVSCLHAWSMPARKSFLEDIRKSLALLCIVFTVNDLSLQPTEVNSLTWMMITDGKRKYEWTFPINISIYS